MTGDARREAIKALIAKHTKKVTSSKEAARKSLINEGFYTQDGNLTARYGGKKKSAA